jgi:hypothetical protein
VLGDVVDHILDEFLSLAFARPSDRLLVGGNADLLTFKAQINVFGEALNDAIDLRERRSTFECERRSSHCREQPVEGPTNPKVLFDNVRRESASRRRLDEEVCPVARFKLCYPAHAYVAFARSATTDFIQSGTSETTRASC